MSTFTPTAPLVVYRNEIELAFNRRKTLLFGSVSTQFQAKGHQAVFQVADADLTYAVKRGANGLIPSETFSQEQLTATMEIQFAKDTRTIEDAMGSQGDIVSTMVEAAAGKIARSIDKVITDTLDTATQTMFNANPLSTIGLNVFTSLKAQLTKARVPSDGSIYCVIQPSVEAQLYNLPSFASSLMVNTKPIPGADLDWKDEIKMYNWLGINFIVLPDLPGQGTASETNYIYHKRSVGLAADVSGGSPIVSTGYNEENAYHFVNADFYMGAKVIQNTGIIKFFSNGENLITDLD
tara:strand:- start:4668 stop:5549 length:882 start_codon:yes stop_codon:yes gene_type:complete